MTVKQRKQFDTLVKKVDEQIEVCSRERDKLADLFNKVEDILSSWDDGIDNLERGLSLLKEGIEDLSRLV